MAVKTITIDLAAYDALSRRKAPGQSFSDVIKERFGAGTTGRDLADALERAHLGATTVDFIEAEIVRRRRHRARAARL